MNINFGIEKEEFLKFFFEKEFFHKRAVIDPDVLSWEHLNDILYVTEPKAPDMVLHNNGIVSELSYVENPWQIGGGHRRRVKKDVFYQQMRTGATLVLNRIETKSARIKNICSAVSRFSGALTTANGYLAFGGGGTFGNHWDTHDVFAVQLIGRKHWKVYKPSFPLPVVTQTSKNHKADCPEVPVFDGILEAGDILYIPRGWWHNATPLAGGETFHLAIGVHPPQFVDYVQWALRNVAIGQLECRRSLVDPQELTNIVELGSSVIHEILTDNRNVERYLEAAAMLERPSTAFSIEEFGRDVDLRIPDSARIKTSCSYMAFDRIKKIVMTRGQAIQLDDHSYCLLEAIHSHGEVCVSVIQEQEEFENVNDVMRVLRGLARLDLVEIEF